MIRKNPGIFLRIKLSWAFFYTLSQIYKTITVFIFLNAESLRKSVIVNWLKDFDIRQVQYMAGHGSISSTERYRAANVGELEEALKLHHPLG